VEETNSRLRSDLEGANLNLRKALRAQSELKPKVGGDTLKLERLMMSYEDQVERAVIETERAVLTYLSSGEVLQCLRIGKELETLIEGIKEKAC
jgi:hypothetical protein